MLKIGQRSVFMSTVAVIATLMSGAVNAQALRDSQGPAEFPPTSFTANQYVDSRGCVFVRAGIGGATEWVPRVSRSRDQLCGFQPSNVSGATSVPQRANVPNPLDTQVAGIAPRAPAAASAPAPVVAAAPVPVAQTPAPTAAPRANLPTSTTGAINPLTGRPVGAATAVRAPVQTASPSPRVITAPAPTTQPRVLTQAQACVGLSGIQPNLVSQRTGQPINCGNSTTAPRVAAVTSPAVQTSSPSRTQRLNRAQACADSAASGRQYVSASTGLPIQCGSSGGTLARLQADLRLPQRPYTNPLDLAPGSSSLVTNRPVALRSTGQVAYSNPLDGAPGSTTFTPGVNTRIANSCGTATSGLALRCGPQTQSPSGRSNAVVTRARTTTGVGILDDLLNQDPPPYSNPNRTYALRAPTVAEGFAPVWDDGRLNTQRGLPRGGIVSYATAPTQQQTAAQPRVSTRVAAPTQRVEQISGHRYVQVGTFATRSEAQAIAQSLRSRGLPMRIGVFNQQGREMRIVLAGPFNSDNQLQSALGTTRGAGLSSAFTRR